MVDATARIAWLVGAQVQREVKGLDPNSKQRPDLQIVFPGRMMLADVVVSHSLTLDNVAQDRNAPTRQQQRKKKKYADVAARLGAELLNLYSIRAVEWRVKPLDW